MVLTFIASIDLLITLFFNTHSIIAGFIRPLIFVLFVRSVRECWKRVILVLWDSILFVVLIVAYVMFFGWLAYRFFRGTLEGEAFFPTLGDSMFNCLVLLTTANNPDVMLPAYNVNRGYSLFFIIYLIIVLFFLMNLLLAIFYNNYKRRVEKAMDKFVTGRETYLKDAFD